MARPEKRSLERVQYWQGQMLRAQDFLNLQRVGAQRRWWHNRAIHNTYGVAEGLQASLSSSSVSLSPGVAYDILGRELILEKAQAIALPSNIPTGIVGAISLLMRYKPPSRGMHTDEISEVCWSAPGSVVAGTAEFIWKIGDRLNAAEGVAVYAVTTAPGQAFKPDPNYVRISAEPLARPLLASGSTVPGETPWELWTAGFDPNLRGYIVGEETWIDTSSAGFTEIPCYFAWLQGPLWCLQPQWTPPPQLLPALLTNITDASILGFTFQICLSGLTPGPTGLLAERRAESFLASSLLLDPNDFNQFAKQQKLYVSWMACQVPGKACSCTLVGAGTGPSTALVRKT